MVQEGLRKRPAGPLLFMASKITSDYYLGFLLGITTWNAFLLGMTTWDGFLLGITTWDYFSLGMTTWDYYFGWLSTWDYFLLGIAFHLGLLGNIPCYCFGTDSGPFE